MDATHGPSFEFWVSAITRNDLDSIRAMISEGQSLRMTNDNGTSLLMVAASNARTSTEGLKLLLRAGVPLNTRDKDGHTAVSWAAVTGAEEAVQVLLNAGADFNRRSLLVPLPLHLAAREGHASIVDEFLCRKGTAVDAIVDGRGHTPLMLASMQGHTSVLKVLIARNADIDRTDTAGSTALMWAASKGQDQAIKVLASAGAQVNFRSTSGFFPIHVAVQSGCVRAVVSLLDLRAAIDQKSEGQGQTPLMLAVWAGHVEIAAELIKRGADLEVQDFHGMTALKLAEWCVQAADQRGAAATELADKSNYEALVEMLAVHAELQAEE